MRKALLLAVTAAAMLAPVASSTHRAAPTVASHAACSSGYVSAHLSWGDKCLRAGEFCKLGNVEYHSYGFDCPASGHLVAYSGPVASSGSSGGGAACGVERWTVKTLQDRPRLLPGRKTTLHFLVTRPAPHPLSSSRLPFERHIYTVVAAVTLVRQEDDSDLHLVLQEGGYHMIAEAPAPTCDLRATRLRHAQMATARKKVRVCAKARVTGVAFFDYLHGQTGVAPNGIELHPILGFVCLNG